MKLPLIITLMCIFVKVNSDTTENPATSSSKPLELSAFDRLFAAITAVVEEQKNRTNSQAEIVSPKTTTEIVPPNITNRPIIVRKIPIECPNGRSKNKSKELFQAVEKNRTEEVRALLMACEDPNGIWIEEYSPLYQAAATGHTGIALLLIDFGANITYQTTNDQYTPLMAATNAEDAVVVKKLIDVGAPVNQLNRWNQSAVHWASWWGFADILKQLIAAGAVVNGADWTDFTPLSLAATWGNRDKETEIVSILRAAGATH